MRRYLILALPMLLPLTPLPAAAQHWNDTGPGRDLISSTITDFDNFRQRSPQVPGFTPPGTAASAQVARAPIPILDWVPPPTQPAPAARRSAPRRSTNSAPRTRAPVMRDTAPLPAAAPVSGGSDWERSFADRERELERLRRILEEDRLRYQQTRQPQLR